MTEPPDDAPGAVEVTQSGRGGGITYREGEHVVSFDWEFALPPAMALIVGPNDVGWDANRPWAAGRQRAIYDAVGSAVVRQQVPEGGYEVDLATGLITILRTSARTTARRAATAHLREPRSRARTLAARTPLARFLASVVPSWETWPEGAHYDLDALRALAPDERDGAVDVLTARDTTWREVEALALVDTPAARTALDAALRHHTSIDTRLAAAEALDGRDASLDVEAFLALQIRRIDRPGNGLARAVRLAERYDGPVIRQALLWASYNGTECAPVFAALLLRLTGLLPEPLDAATEQLVADLGRYNSSFTRQAAFDALCARVGMVLDTDVPY